MGGRALQQGARPVLPRAPRPPAGDGREVPRDAHVPRRRAALPRGHRRRDGPARRVLVAAGQGGAREVPAHGALLRDGREPAERRGGARRRAARGGGAAVRAAAEGREAQGGEAQGGAQAQGGAEAEEARGRGGGRAACSCRAQEEEPAR